MLISPVTLYRGKEESLSFCWDLSLPSPQSASPAMCQDFWPIFLDPLLYLLPTFTGPVSSIGLYNMGGDPVSVIHNIRNFLDIGRDHKNPREDYLGEFYCPGASPLLSQLLLPGPGHSFSPFLPQMSMCLGLGLW